MPILNRGGGQSRSSVITEPFDHLIQHLKQADPRLYEALKRVSLLQQNIQNIVDISETPFGTFDQLYPIRAIVPGLAIVADDVSTNRYTLKIDDTKKLVLELVTITAKSSPPLSGDYEIDWLRSNDQSVTFTSIFPDGDRPTLGIGLHTVEFKKFAIIELFNGDEMRFDVKQSGDANDMESVIKGKIVDK